MEKNKDGKVIAIVALIVAVVALSVGFAAFEDSLTISGTASALRSNDAFDGTVGSDLRYSANTAKCYLTEDNEKTALTGANVGTLDGDSWSGISVPLGNTATSVTCEATIENNSGYTAYLKSIGVNSGLSCLSSGTNKTSNEDNACGATTVTVAVGDNAADVLEITNAANTNNNTQGSIANGATEVVTVTIEYDGAVIDENVTITIPTITHSYSSAQ